MSFDIFVIIADPGIPAGMLRKLFGLTQEGAPDSSDEWPLQDCALRLTKGAENNVTHISVHRPTGDEVLWNGLFAVVRRGDAVFFFPSDHLIPVVSDPAAVGMMPEAMRESFGQPHIVHSAQQLMDSLDL